MKLRGASLDMVAGLYVLGVSSPRVRRRFEALAVQDPQVRAAQDRWSRQLAALRGWVPPVRPQPATLPALLARLPLRRGERSSTRGRGLRQALAASVLGAALALGWFYYDSRYAPVLTAEIHDAAGLPNWDFAAPADAHQLKVTVKRPNLVPVDHSFEIWALAESGAAVSLGLVPPDQDQVLALDATQRQALLGARRLAITVEPPGGSPTGRATGAIIHVAALSRRS
jgi:anti-sigma-K factor RskA